MARVSFKKGDVVLFHTGWLSLVGEDNERFGKAQPGLGVDGAKYLAEQGVVAVGADNWGLEVIPFEDGTGVFEVHQTLLAKHGVYILENMNTARRTKGEPCVRWVALPWFNQGPLSLLRAGRPVSCHRLGNPPNPVFVRHCGQT
jgi:kynurenine formamidase